MKAAIMQPYFFPYLGYWQLIHAVDAFVLYDDVAFIKGGWINRNRILEHGGPAYLTLQTRGASPNKAINQIMVGDNTAKLLKTLRQNYARAPCCGPVMRLLEALLGNGENNLARFLENTIRGVCAYLGIDTRILVASQLASNPSLRKEARVIDLCAQLQADTYINAIGGQSLYDPTTFARHGIEIRFIQSRAVEYRQFANAFVPWLSIIDVMMFNPPDRVRHLLDQYDLVT